MASPVVVSRIQNRRGTQAQFDALYPPGYNGIGGASITLWPNILLPGELALVTDTRRIYIGNLNGEYTQLATGLNGDPVLEPTTWVLPPSATYTIITKTLPGPTVVNFEYAATPFFDIVYDITDSASADWDTVGTTYSANGEMHITAIDPLTALPPVVPPTPPLTHASLTDDRTEINTVLPNTISFKAQYDITMTNIEIHYMHDFAGPLTLNTSTIRWIPF